jgi:predicted aspartyl protease
MFDSWIDLEDLNRGDEHPLAIIPVRVVGPTGEEPARSVIDTGSSVSIFPRSMLERIGVDFSEKRVVHGATSAGDGVYFQGEPEAITVICWHHDALVHAIGSDVLKNPMLGLNDFFKQFRIDFRPGPGGPQFRIERPG